MEIILNDQIFQDFKGIKITAMFIENFNNKDPNGAIIKLLDELIKYYDIVADKILQEQKDKIWEKYHKVLNINDNPKLIRHSYIEKILQAIIDKKSIKSNPLNNLTKYCTLKKLIPVIAFDYDKIKKNIEISSDNRFGFNIKTQENKHLLQNLGYYINNSFEITNQTKSAIIFIIKLDFVSEIDYKSIIDDVNELIYISFNTKPLIKQLTYINSTIVF